MFGDDVKYWWADKGRRREEARSSAYESGRSSARRGLGLLGGCCLLREDELVYAESEAEAELSIRKENILNNGPLSARY